MTSMRSEMPKEYYKGVRKLRQDLNGLELNPIKKPSAIIEDMSDDKKQELAQPENLVTTNPQSAEITPKKGYSSQEQEAHSRERFPEFYQTQTSEIVESKPNAQISRRRFLIGAGAAVLASALAGNAIGGLTKFKLPELGNTFYSSNGPYENTPYHIGEGEPRSGKTVLGNQEYNFQEEMAGYLSYVPDGPITYWTTKEGKKRYLLTGGDGNQAKKWTGNATYMIEIEGSQSLRDKMASGTITSDSFTQVFKPNSPESEGMEGEWYTGVTSALQNPNNRDDLWGTVHKEIRPNRNASGAYQAEVLIVRSKDGGKTWDRTGTVIKGTDPRNPGYVDSYGELRVTGAGEPTSIYNPVDGYSYFAWVDWRGEKRTNESKRQDEVYMARAKMSASWEMGQLEYWTNDGYSTQFNGDKLKAIIPVPSDEFVYTALPKLSWNTEINQWHCSGESDNGFWEATSKNLIDWTQARLIYNFSDKITQLKRPFPNPDDSTSTPGPVESKIVSGRPHNVLLPGEKWDSYPTLLSEEYPNSTLIGKKGIFYHSTGDNAAMHEPATLDFTTRLG